MIGVTYSSYLETIPYGTISGGNICSLLLDLYNLILYIVPLIDRFEKHSVALFVPLTVDMNVGTVVVRDGRDDGTDGDSASPEPWPVAAPSVVWIVMVVVMVVSMSVVRMVPSAAMSRSVVWRTINRWTVTTAWRTVARRVHSRSSRFDRLSWLTRSDRSYRITRNRFTAWRFWSSRLCRLSRTRTRSLYRSGRWSCAWLLHRSGRWSCTWSLNRSL